MTCQLFRAPSFQLKEESTVKTHRRIEITAFRRRVTISSGGLNGDVRENEEISINDVDSHAAIETESDEGQRILAETVRLIENNLTGRAKTAQPN